MVSILTRNTAIGLVVDMLRITKYKGPVFLSSDPHFDRIHVAKILSRIVII